MKIPKMQWVIAAMLFCATAINYGDRLALSIVSHKMRLEFHMTELPSRRRWSRGDGKRALIKRRAGS